MRALVAGPCVSELGWELMEWQGYVRKQAKGIPPDCVIVSSTDGLHPLYSDFCGHFVPHNIKCDRDGHQPRGGRISNPEEVARVNNEIASRIRELRKRGYDIVRLRSWVRKPPRRKLSEQQFIQYGVKRETPWKLVVHARDRACSAPFAGDNYPQASWDRLLLQLVVSKTVKLEEVVAIGTKDAAMLPDGATDRRGVSLSETMSIISSARLVIGPSSGPMHLAALCRTPHVVWATSRYQSLIGGGNESRYLSDWNPFRTPVEVLLHRKGVVLPAAMIAAAITKLLKETLGEGHL